MGHIDNPILKPGIELPMRKKWSHWMARAPLDEKLSRFQLKKGDEEDCSSGLGETYRPDCYKEYYSFSSDFFIRYIKKYKYLFIYLFFCSQPLARI